MPSQQRTLLLTTWLLGGTRNGWGPVVGTLIMAAASSAFPGPCRSALISSSHSLWDLGPGSLVSDQAPGSSDETVPDQNQACYGEKTPIGGDMGREAKARLLFKNRVWGRNREA